MPFKCVQAGSSYYKTIIRKDHCALCGNFKDVKKNRTVDHIHPTYMGGWNSWSNFAGLCSKCNSRKSSMTLLDTLMGHKQAVFQSSSTNFEEENAMPVRWYDPLEIYGWSE